MSSPTPLGERLSRSGLPLYEVFARRQREDGVRHIGTVEAPSTEMARVYARSLYDEEDWIEMWIVERADIVTVTALEKGA